LSLFIDKPSARIFAFTVLAVGLIMRGLAKESAQRKAAATQEAALAAAIVAMEKGSPATATRTSTAPTPPADQSKSHPIATPSPRRYNGPILTAVRGLGRTLEFAINEAIDNGQPLYVLYVREQPVIAPGDRRRKWTEDKQAREVFESLRARGLGETIIPCYAVSDAPAHTIADLASTIGAERVLLGAPQRGTLIHILRGNIVREVAKLLPEDIHLLVCV